jgi:Vacuolar sorting-associated protein 13, N-terminal
MNTNLAVFYSETNLDKPHMYIWDSLEAEIRLRASDRTKPGPVSCSADVMPFDFTFNIHPYQYKQYQSLMKAIGLQKRFDTMIRQRPSVSIKDNPRTWWKYAFACITSRPNTRQWTEVEQIVGHRKRYIELVVKKNMSAPGGGFHSGLSDKESAELLEIEELLPIEALSAFHLIALRSAYAQTGEDRTSEYKDGTKVRSPRRNGKFSPFRLIGDGGVLRRRPPVSGEVRTESSNRASRSLNAAPNTVDLLKGLDTGRKLFSLFQAMTLRLGQKSWFVDWKIHDAVINVQLHGSRDKSVFAQLTLRFKGSARSFGLGKRDFFFDVVQFSVLHKGREVLYVRPVDDELFEDLDDILEEQEEQGDNSRTPFFFRYPRRKSAVKGPDLDTPSKFLDLPPSDVVCRIVAAKCQGVIKTSISAHPATLLWSTNLYDGLSDFFFSSSSGSANNLADYIRNAATPLAKKAQFALLSPASMSLYVNIAAPKVWLSVKSRNDEGALLLDAGMLKVSSKKEEGQTDMNWDIQARDIQVNFAKGKALTGFTDNFAYKSFAALNEYRGRSDSCVVRPFNVSAVACDRVYSRERSGVRSNFQFSSGTMRSIEVHVSPVCLNLVDGEILARSFGKWYARGINRVQHRSSSSSSSSSATATTTRAVSVPDTEMTKGANGQGTGTAQLNDLAVRHISLEVDKIELALEGHSKSSANVSDERSFISLDSYHEFSPPTRTYLVELFQIRLKRYVQGQRAYSNVMLHDASIVRLRDGSLYYPLRTSKEMIDSQYCILVRSHSSTMKVSSVKLATVREEEEIADIVPVASATFLHDGYVHLDEVEVDFDSVVLRVTPTTLKDCSKAFKRVVELVQVMTKEMERKVHEEGRKARRKDRKGKSTLCYYCCCFVDDVTLLLS